MRSILAITLALTFAAAASAGEIVIPAVYRGPGIGGTQWKTEIAVSNVSSDLTLPFQSRITLHREGAPPVEIQLALAPKETVAVPDAVREWFDVENGGGVVRITWDQPNTRIAARARIYTDGATGQFGQGVPGVTPDDLRTENFLPGISGVDGNRTNVGISNPHETDVLVWIWLYDTAGLARGGFTYLVPARSYRQLNDIFQYFEAGPLHAAMIGVFSTSLPVYAYASVVRDDTGDATFVTPQ